MHTPRFLALAVLVALTLAACSSPATIPTPSLTPPSSSESLLNPELQARPISPVTEESAHAEASRLADALLALIDPATIVSVEEATQLAPAQDDLASYFMLARTITMDSSVDCLTLAETITGVMEQSGWSVYDSANGDTTYRADLTGGSEAAPWFAVIGADTTDGRSIVTVQIASADIDE